MRNWQIMRQVKTPSLPVPHKFSTTEGGCSTRLLVAAVLVYERHLQYVNHPADVMSYGCMYAFGDLILGLPPTARTRSELVILLVMRT
jgi:hypothetical protein